MSRTTTPITLHAPKPRNPFVAASRMRRAGAHGAGGGALRQQAQRSLQCELARLRTHSP